MKLTFIKKAIVLFALCSLACWANEAMAQNTAANLVQNPSFEDISQPVTGGGQIENAHFWERSYCGKPISFQDVPIHTPDLFDVNFVYDYNTSVTNYVEIPANKWTFSLPERTSLERYAGISLQIPHNINQPITSDERATNILKNPLPEGDNYYVSVYVAIGDTPFLNAHENRVQLVLKEDNNISTNCSEEKIILTTLHITHNGWIQYGAFFDISAQDHNRFKVLEIRLKEPDTWVANENLQIFMDDFQMCPPPGTIQLKANSVCEGSNVILGANELFVDEGTVYNLTIEDVTPGVNNPQIMHYHGCGSPDVLNLTDPNQTELCDGFGSLCNGVECNGNFTPFPFVCHDNCGFYKIIFEYQLCGHTYTEEFTLHVLCSPEVSAITSPNLPCPGDDILYCVDDPQSVLAYYWFDQNGQLSTTSNGCTGPHPLDLNNPIYVLAIDQSNGCRATFEPTIELSDDCLLCPDNIINDGIFSQVTASCVNNNPLEPFANNCVTYWENSHGKPTLGTGVTNYFAHLRAKKILFGNNHRGDGIMTDVAVTAGQNLSGSIDVYVDGNPAELIIRLENNVTATNNAVIPNYTGIILWTLDLTNFPVGWHTFNLPTKVSDANYSQLLIYPKEIGSNGGIEVDVDNICLERQSIVCDMVVDLGADFDLCFTYSAILEAEFSGGVGPFVYSWTPATYLADPTSSVTGFSPPLKGAYSYTFTVTDANNCTASDNINIQVIDCGEGHRAAFETDSEVFKIYPNPSSGHLTLTYDLEEDGNVQVFDLMGKMIFARNLPVGSSQTTLELEDLAPGIYLTRVGANGKILFQKKIVIQR